MENDVPGRPTLDVRVTVGDELHRALIPAAESDDDRRFVLQTTCDAHLHVMAVGPDVRIAFDRSIPCPSTSP
ncbi:hypothetical protein DVK02_11350 [Halobellus sp. Atlit-31R]|nr:hypothetical protein DVK02_11350 [Halobellus sp. Atlit-31R]